MAKKRVAEGCDGRKRGGGSSAEAGCQGAYVMAPLGGRGGRWRVSLLCLGGEGARRMDALQSGANQMGLNGGIPRGAAGRHRWLPPLLPPLLLPKLMLISS